MAGSYIWYGAEFNSKGSGHRFYWQSYQLDLDSDHDLKTTPFKLKVKHENYEIISPISLK